MMVLLVVMYRTGTGELVRELAVGSHTDSVTCLSYSGDGQRLVSGSRDTNLVVWDALTGSRMALLEKHTREITAAIWLDSSSRKREGSKNAARAMASASLDSSLLVWQEQISGMGGQYGSGAMEVRYEAIWKKDWLPSPVFSLAYTNSTAIALYVRLIF